MALDRRRTLRALDGIRVLSNLGVVASHTAFHAKFRLDRDFVVNVAVQRHGWLRAAGASAVVGMDGFLILTGFLAAWHLLPALQPPPQNTTSSTPKETVLNYYRNRIRRIVPPLWLCLALMTFVLTPLVALTQHTFSMHTAAVVGVLNQYPTSCDIPTHASEWLFFINLTPSHGCYIWLWSLSVQMQFYFLFPLLLLALNPKRGGFQGRLTFACAAMAVLSLAYKIWVLLHMKVMLPLEDGGLMRFEAPWDMPENTLNFLRFAHGSFMSRILHFALGCWVAVRVDKSQAATRLTAQTQGDTMQTSNGTAAAQLSHQPHDSSRQEAGKQYTAVQLSDQPHADKAQLSHQARGKKMQASQPNKKHTRQPWCHWTSPLAILVTALVCMLMFAKLPPGRKPDPASFPVLSVIGLGVIGGVVFPVAVGFLVYWTAVAPDRISRLVAGMLSHPVMALFAKFSYGTYLVHMHVGVVVLMALPSEVHWNLESSVVGLAMFLGYLSVVYLVSFVLGMGLELAAGSLVKQCQRLLWGTVRTEAAVLEADKKHQ